MSPRRTYSSHMAEIKTLGTHHKAAMLLDGERERELRREGGKSLLAYVRGVECSMVVTVGCTHAR